MLALASLTLSAYLALQSVRTSAQGVAEPEPADLSVPRPPLGPAFARPNGFDVSSLSVPRTELISGGPPRDGIPAIMNPTFVAADRALHVEPGDSVIGVVIGGEARAYPLRILLWHEIVNDVLAGEPLAITYCPLCGTAMVFRSQWGETHLTFGVSGLLYNSDVLMYDHQTESLWSQLKMEAISGEMNGTRLEWLPSRQTTWVAWLEEHPNSLVLSEDTGHARDYSIDPYPDYKQRVEPLFPVPRHREELAPMDWIAGVLVNGQAKAYPVKALVDGIDLSDSIGGEPMVVRYHANADSITVENGSGDAIPVVRAYWFAWQAFYPETALYDASD